MPTLVDVKWVRFEEIKRYKVFPVQLAYHLENGWTNLGSANLYQMESKQLTVGQDLDRGVL
jgi:hypothetical protein